MELLDLYNSRIADVDIIMKKRRRMLRLYYIGIAELIDSVDFVS